LNYPTWYAFPVFLAGIFTGGLLCGSALGVVYLGNWALESMPWAAGIALAVSAVCFVLARDLDSRYKRGRTIRRRLQGGLP
jgi:predicted MFS family arabinose efflux permease